MKLKLITMLFIAQLYAVSASAAQVVLSWSGMSATPTTYKVFRATSSGGYDFSSPVYTGAGSTTTATLTTLTSGTTYYFVVRGYVNTDESTSSSEVSCTAKSTSQTLSPKFTNVWYARGIYEYYGTTDKTVTCSWVATCTAEGYEVRLLNLDKNSEVTLSNNKVTTTSITFTLPKTGHYVVKVRACRNSYTEFSDWAISSVSTNSIVNGNAMGWGIYGTVASPGSISIQ